MKILIIEDEQHTANDLASTIKKVEVGAEIVGILKSVKESVAWFEQNRIKLDLIFSDIQLGDGLSFEIFKQVDIHTPVVFCTAYDEYALNAFKVNSIHYMLKPFNSKTVVEALSKFRDLRSTMSPDVPSYQAILDLLNERKRTTSVLVYQGDRIVPVKLDDIALSFIRDEMTHIITFDQKEYRLNKSLEEMEKLSSGEFFRANRQFLVNRRVIKDSSQYFSRKLVVNLNIPFDEKITISKTKVMEYLNWLAES
ncbi:MAG: LytTR family DNA-binding domain-containing protein [Bacteroides sp.]|jgi:DNA-binding LytR/AlgR family response regulator|nr:LytTR family DNA-binding domain-containing protein [Bacteroides sp.]